MSALNRTCLRLAAVAALKGQTLAGGNVLDSGMGAIDAMQPEERVPMISVYTEEDGGEALSEQNGGQVKEEVELVFDISMVEALFQSDGTIIIGQPQTDDQLEVTLDLVEAQIHRTLFEDVTLPLSVAFRDALLRVCHRESLRFRDEKAGERMAHRYVIYRVQVQDEPLLIAYDPALTGLDRLPKVFAKVAAQWPDDLYEKTVALAIADKLAQPATQPLRSVDVVVAPTGMADAPACPATASAKAGNIGNGIMVLTGPGILDGAQPGIYKIIFATATTFTVTDPSGDLFASGRIATDFADQIAFTIAAGSTGFVAGDEFDIAVNAVLSASWDFQQ